MTHTQNETLNNSVALYAPKSKTYLLNNSLHYQVLIAPGIKILRFEMFWSRVVLTFGIDPDSNLRKSLRDRDFKKRGQNQYVR